jgi:hypothetical protein
MAYVVTGSTVVRVLFADIALDGLVVVGGVGIGGFDAVHIAIQSSGDHARENLGVPHREFFLPPFQ